MPDPQEIVNAAIHVANSNKVAAQKTANKAKAATIVPVGRTEPLDTTIMQGSSAGVTNDCWTQNRA